MWLYINTFILIVYTSNKNVLTFDLTRMKRRLEVIIPQNPLKTFSIGLSDQYNA